MINISERQKKGAGGLRSNEVSSVGLYHINYGRT
jgi:hypothetical protein